MVRGPCQMRPPRKRKTSRRLIIGAVSLVCAIALPGEVMAQGADCSLCVKDGDVYDLTSSLCFSPTQAPFLPPTSKTLKGDMHQCPDYPDYAAGLLCVDCLRQGNRFVLGVDKVPTKNQCVATSNPALDSKLLGDIVLENPVDCAKYNLQQAFGDFKTCVDCTLNKRHWYEDPTLVDSGQCLDEGATGSELQKNKANVAYSPLQCAPGSCFHCLGGQWCFAGGDVNQGVCTPPKTDCIKLGLNILPAYDAVKLASTCTPMSELKTKHRECNSCLGVGGAYWCEPATRSGFCFYNADYTRNCLDKDTSLIANFSACPAPKAIVARVASTSWDMCWDTKDFRCVMVGYIFPAALAATIFCVALLLGCICGGKAAMAAAIAPVTRPLSNMWNRIFSPVVKGENKDAHDDAFKRAELADF